jgi:hypothetical protein
MHGGNELFRISKMPLNAALYLHSTSTYIIPSDKSDFMVILAEISAMNRAKHQVALPTIKNPQKLFIN